MLWIWIFVFLAAFILDVVPFPAPPAWTVMVILQMHYSLNIWYVVLIGVFGSVCGRYLMSIYFRKISDHFISLRKNQDMQFLGDKISSNRARGWLFVFIYTLVPLPSTPLFHLMGIARISAFTVLPAFFAGKFISDFAMLYTGNIVAQDIPALLMGMLTLKSLLVFILAIVILAAFLFIDWWTLIEKKQLKFNFNIWKKQVKNVKSSIDTPPSSVNINE
jgi:membrane protein DedA with SNARE-associated domain